MIVSIYASLLCVIPNMLFVSCLFNHAVTFVICMFFVNTASETDVIYSQCNDACVAVSWWKL